MDRFFPSLHAGLRVAALLMDYICHLLQRALSLRTSVSAPGISGVLFLAVRPIA